MSVAPGAGDIVRGEFYTDGETYVFTLAGTPLSGTGNSPDAAFADLIRTDVASGDLGLRLKALARDQAGETARTAVIRAAVSALIAFGIAGGALVGAIAMAPMVVQAVADSTGVRLASWVETMSPETERKVARLLHGDGAPAPSPPAPQP